jgi:hypothetical protein
VITPIIRPLISDKQHDFVGGRSTMTSLVEFSNFVLSEMKDGLQVDAVYTNFSEAFDSGFFWMVSYLTIRTQRVRVGNYLSETIYLHSGVPPLFFIADISDVLGYF